MAEHWKRLPREVVMAPSLSSRSVWTVLQGTWIRLLERPVNRQELDSMMPLVLFQFSLFYDSVCTATRINIRLQEWHWDCVTFNHRIVVCIYPVSVFYASTSAVVVNIWSRAIGSPKLIQRYVLTQRNALHSNFPLTSVILELLYSYSM